MSLVKIVGISSDCSFQDGGGQNKGFILGEQKPIEGVQSGVVIWSELGFRRDTLAAIWRIDRGQ